MIRKEWGRTQSASCCAKSIMPEGTAKAILSSLLRRVLAARAQVQQGMRRAGILPCPVSSAQCFSWIDLVFLTSLDLF